MIHLFKKAFQEEIKEMIVKKLQVIPGGEMVVDNAKNMDGSKLWELYKSVGNEVEKLIPKLMPQREWDPIDEETDRMWGRQTPRHRFR
jgi:hypothetical protein